MKIIISIISLIMIFAIAGCSSKQEKMRVPGNLATYSAAYQQMEDALNITQNNNGKKNVIEMVFKS